MIRTLGPWAGFAAALAAFLFALAPENRGGEGLSGAMPVGEDTLIAARGLNPNYLSYNATYICCFSNDVGAEVCDCTDWPRNTVCIYCSGFGALSGNYSAGKGGSVQPSGGSVDCNLTMQLFIGVCDGGIDCDFAVPIGAVRWHVSHLHLPEHDERGRIYRRPASTCDRDSQSSVIAYPKAEKRVKWPVGR